MKEEKTSSEPKRGCGFRQVGKLYLIGDGIEYICPSLPLSLDPCVICGYAPAQYRDFMWVPKAYFKDLKMHNPTGQACLPNCPICYPDSSNDHEKYGLMWVGRKYYTPESFIAEDKSVGICKAIKQVPKGLVLGESWVLLAHPQAISGFRDREDQETSIMLMTGEQGDDETIPPSTPGVFYAFIPTRIEVLLYKSQAFSDRISEIEAKGITPIIVPDEYTAHSRRTRTVRGRENIA